jgi:hypothetical protein
VSETAWERALTLTAAGGPIDWDALLAEVASPAERAKLEDLRELCEALGSNAPPAGQSSSDTIGVSAPPGPAAPERWGSLEILEVIGGGSQGMVYRAWDTRLAREVALKLLVDSGSAPDSLSEARRLAKIEHPNVVTVFGADRANGQLGIWMELLRGRTLDQVIRDQGEYSVREAIGIAIEVCGAVAAIHKAGLIHRDIKAQNVMRLPGGRIVVMDLGASQEPAPDDSAVRSLAGTPLYMAPELFTGLAATTASDVYAIGVLLYRMVTGEFPIDANTLGDVRKAHQIGQLRPLREVRPSLPSGFVALVGRCLSADPSKRFATAAHLEHALIDLGREGIDNARSARPRWMLAAGFTALGAALVAGGMFSWTAIQRSRRESTATATPSGVSPDQNAVLFGYQDVAFSSLASDPQRAARAMVAAINVIRGSMPGQHPWFTLLYAQHAAAERAAGDREKTRRALEDGSAHAFGSATHDHPYSAVLAMENARYAQSIQDHARAAREIAQALEIRWHVLDLDKLATRKTSRPSEPALMAASAGGAMLIDTDGDGIADVIEKASGLNPSLPDSDHDGVDDVDEDRDDDGVPNGLELGILGSPFLTWAQYGRIPPRALGWQSPPEFPVIESPLVAPRESWTMTSPQAGTYLFHHLSSAHTARAVEKGFVLFVRGEAVRGIADVLVDLSPAGARFDVIAWPHEGDRVPLQLPTSIAPLEGSQVSAESRDWPLLELRFHPKDQTVSLHADGRLIQRDYRGFHKFQEANSAAISFAVASMGDGTRDLTARYQLVWLEIR